MVLNLDNTLKPKFLFKAVTILATPCSKAKA